MVKNGHFSPFFGPKTHFFAIFWHPENPPSKTPFLAVLHLGLRERPPGPERSFQTFPVDLSDREGGLLSLWLPQNIWCVSWPLRGHLNINRIVTSRVMVGLAPTSETCSFLFLNILHVFLSYIYGPAQRGQTCIAATILTFDFSKVPTRNVRDRCTSLCGFGVRNC